MDRQLREKARMAKCSLQYLGGGQSTVKFFQFFYKLKNFHNNILAKYGKKKKQQGLGTVQGIEQGEEEANMPPINRPTGLQALYL